MHTYKTLGSEIYIQTATVAILDIDGNAIIANSSKLGIGTHKTEKLIGEFTNLSTSAIWTCAAFSIKQKNMKLLVHAYEPYDIMYSLKFLKESGFKVSKTALLDLYLNPLQKKHHRGFLWNIFRGGVNILKVKTHNVKDTTKIIV